jgi:hypothetical protein
VTKRALLKAQARWETDTRSWAAEAARAVLLAICGGDPLPITPYRVGAVLNTGEHAMAEVPARVDPDAWMTETRAVPSVRPWLVTSERILGRLADGRLAEWRWRQIMGCQIDLTPGDEVVSVDTSDGALTQWLGPGVAPLAVVAVARLYGPQSLLDHPGLTPLRTSVNAQKTNPPESSPAV